MEMFEKSHNYKRIAKAIEYIIDNHTKQPNLEEIANHIHLSPFHFQRLFQEWAGTTPKKFLQYINLTQAKKLLQQSNSILSTSNSLGLSSSSRLHDLFVSIEAMTPAEYKNGGVSLTIYYSFQESPFGQLIIASTAKGICHISFIENKEEGFNNLIHLFPNASLKNKEDIKHREVMKVFDLAYNQPLRVNIHLKGSAFQLKVWEALIKIPYGNLKTYSDIAKFIQNPSATRAVGTAIGKNPIAYLIPCHRIIQASGVIGGYMWNPTRKTAIIGWEKMTLEK